MLERERLEGRATVRTYGGLEVHLPAREDLVCFRLYAAVDQGERSRHFADLRRLSPTPGQLLNAARWTRTHDPSPPFLGELQRILGLSAWRCPMAISSRRSAATFADQSLALAWGAWTQLGVSGWTSTHGDWAVDPEPLILFTAWLGDADPRLRDEATDWCVQNWRHISKARLKNLLREQPDDVAAAFGEFGATVAAHAGNQLAWGNPSPAVCRHRPFNAPKPQTAFTGVAPPPGDVRRRRSSRDPPLLPRSRRRHHERCSARGRDRLHQAERC